MSEWAPLRAADQATSVLSVIGSYGDLDDRPGSTREAKPTSGAQTLARVALLAGRR